MVKFRWENQYYRKNKKDNQSLYVRPGCNLKVRLVGEPVKVVRAFTNDDRCIMLDSEETGQKLKEKYPNKIGNISVRYACWCFDRHDDKIKVLEMPKFVFNAIGKQSKSGKKKISEQEDGCDFRITTNDKTGMDVRYTVDYEKDTSLTDIEKHMILVQQANKKRPYDLTKLFKSCSYLDAGVKLSRQEK